MKNPTRWRRRRGQAAVAVVLMIAAAGALPLACRTSSISKEAISTEVTGKEASGTAVIGKAASGREVTGKEADPGEGHAAKARDVLLGRRAPAVELELLDGGRVRLEDLSGQRPVYLEFWNTWCVPCREQ